MHIPILPPFTSLPRITNSTRYTSDASHTPPDVYYHDLLLESVYFFFFQAEDGIRDWSVTGVQTCALPIFLEDPSWETPLFHLFDAIAEREDAALIAVCHTFGLMCRWLDVADPVARGPEKGDRKSVV